MESKAHTNKNRELNNLKKMRPKIVFMLGYPRSGSTVYGELINQSEHFLHVGEMERLWYPKNVKASLYPQKGCSCGKRLCDCDFWLPYLEMVAKEVKVISAKRGMELNNKILCSYKEGFIQKQKFMERIPQFIQK